MIIGKSHQRIIRERFSREGNGILFPDPSPENLRGALVKKISTKEAASIILKYEWLGTMPPCIKSAWGVFFDGVCGGAIIFSEPTQKNVVKAKTIPVDALYLSRGACAHWTPKNTASFLISAALKMMGNVVAYGYCDHRAGEVGQIYQALNWLYLGPSKGGAHAFTVDGKEVSTRYLRRKYGSCSIETVRNIYPGSDIKKAPRKGRYVGVYGDRRHRKYWDGQLRPLSLPYPKRS